MAVSSIDAREPGRMTRLGHTLLHEFRQVLPPTIFFFIGFNLILFTKRLILEDYLIQFAGFFIATTAALIVGKVVLVADILASLRSCPAGAAHHFQDGGLYASHLRGALHRGVHPLRARGRSGGSWRLHRAPAG